MKKFCFRGKRKDWLALTFILAICILTMVCASQLAAAPFDLDYAHLQFRNYENAANRYQRVIGISDNGGPIQQTDIIEVRMRDSGGSAVYTVTGGFYHQTFMLLDCTSGTCAQSGPFEDTGIWDRYSMLAADTYHIEIDMENGEMLSTSIYYQGGLELPYVSGTDMLANWIGGDLVLSWANPVTDPAWSEVDQVRINVFDNNDNVVLRVKTAPSTTTVTIPAALVSQAQALLGGNSLAQWEVQTRAYDTNDMNFARGYSSRISIQPDDSAPADIPDGDTTPADDTDGDTAPAGSSGGGGGGGCFISCVF